MRDDEKIIMVTMTMLGIIIGTLFGHVMCSYQPTETNWYDWPEGSPNLGHYWSCMDGCYEAQLIYEEEFNITRSKTRHDKCSAACWKTLGFPEGGFDEMPLA